MTHSPTLEICCADIASVRAAYDGGADRVELCCALPLGGLTPSIGLIREAVKVKQLARTAGSRFDVHVLIRPREGDFVYSSEEVNAMLHDIEMLLSAGADGVVIGALTPEGDIDTEAVRRMVEKAAGADVTFHRAFDMCRDPNGAMLLIADLGISRILTSGCAASAEEGITTLSELILQAPQGLVIMAGGGIIPPNIRKIRQQTGINEFHASAKSIIPSSMAFRRDDVKMGSKDFDEYSRLSVSHDTVRKLSSALKS